MGAAVKTCLGCGIEKQPEEFYCHNGKPYSRCKPCVRAAVTQYRQRNIDKVRAYDRARGARQPNSYRREWYAKNAQTVMEKQRERRARDPLVKKARERVRYALASGKLVRGPCAVCGSQDTHGHHEDYSKPLDVIWLCPTHHGERHREINEQRRSAA